MKAAMSFKKRRHTFNSLREAAKNIVGHKDADITPDRYAGTSGLDDKLTVIQTIVYPI